VELVRAFHRAYYSLEITGHVVATDVDDLAPALQVVDRTYLVPRFTDPEFIPALVEICQREEIDVVFPLIDPDIPLLADHRDAVQATGARVAVVPPAAARISADKWIAYDFFNRLGLATPQSWLPDDLPWESLEYPLFIKPRCGSAAANTFQVNDARELRFFLDYVPDPIVQEHIDGPEITSDIVCDLDGQVLAVVSRQRLAVRTGEVVKGFTVYDAEIAQACRQIAAELPAVGPITAQCMMKDGVPHFIEINARLGGGIPLAIAAGVDVPALLLASVAGIPVEPLAPPGYELGLHITRFDDSFFITEDHRANTACRRL
jgi:carbamoyl-phosphate synthase large subunit